MITLSAVDLSLAAGLVLAMAALSWRMQLGLSGQLLIAGTRTVVQLLLIGLVLKALFANVDLLWVTGISLVMLLAAGREVMARHNDASLAGGGLAWAPARCLSPLSPLPCWH